MLLVIKMFALKVVLFCFLFSYSTSSSLNNRDVHTFTVTTDDDNSGPLFLSPLIKEGLVTEAQQAAEVVSLANNPYSSYSGFITVNEEYDSNLFFWFFPALENPDTAPLLVWLNGGPGTSSLYGLFIENGPFYVDANYTMHLRNITWIQTNSIIYIDNPAGTGYSFTNSEKGYAKNYTDYGNDLYEFLIQWFQLFPDYQTRDFYLSGESYAGKYIPSLAYKIYQEKLNSNNTINLKGIAIGNGLCDPPNMINYTAVLYPLGLIDDEQKEYFEEKQNLARSLLEQDKYAEAHKVLGNLIKNTADGSSYFSKVSGFTNLYNYLYSTEPADFSYYPHYLKKSEVAAAIHVGNLSHTTPSAVFDNLYVDYMHSIKPLLQDLLNSGEYEVMLYSGQLDLTDGYSLTNTYVHTMQWAGSDEFFNANRTIWRVNDQIAGYAHYGAHLTQVLVRDGGHILPYDQPAWAYDMINRFVNGEKFD